jgi:hypothetical protein
MGKKNQGSGSSPPPQPKGKNPFGGKELAAVHCRGASPAWPPQRPPDAGGADREKKENGGMAAAMVVLAITGGAPTAGLGRRRIEPSGSDKQRRGRVSSATPP